MSVLSSSKEIKGRKEKFSSSFITFWMFSLGFLGTIILGTVSHEYGHIAVANYLGYTTKLHFNSMTYAPFTGHGNIHDFHITLGGVLLTSLIGTFGVVVLKNKKTPDFLFWVSIFFALFWSRPVVNLTFKCVSCIFNENNGLCFGGDELLLSQFLGLHNGFFSILFAAIGFIVLFYIYFFKIPSNHQIVFAFSGVFGGGISYYLWFNIVGPILLP